MAKFNINGFTSEGGGGFTPIPEGVYEALIIRATVTNFGTGNPGIKLMLTIRDDVDQPYRNRKLFDNLTLTKNAMYKFEMVAKAAGFSDELEITSLEQFGDLILNKPVQVKVVNEPDNKNPDRIRERISVYKQGLELSEDTEIPASDDETDEEIAERIKEILRQKTGKGCVKP
ncbi:DUF669 domain-containing protein [Brevibacillus gelatini]|uniref:DUF669 domain-containing protein n=1 Tax=Brevibacillus gelatini TaxID=1655277 RepID=A0A3M8ARZ4_9BACL|nr:DUF669 domain-containing protein [Brevibacillus gelatini]RNB53899.1 DUF669 domain-containing protein [Brevibacillus gelatini]